MALYYDLPVFKEVYQLVLKIFDYTKDFPKEYKYTLGQDMKRDGIQLVRSIYRANKAKDKVVYLESFLDDFEVLKFEIRLSVSSSWNFKVSGSLPLLLQHRRQPPVQQGIFLGEQVGLRTGLDGGFALEVN